LAWNKGGGDKENITRFAFAHASFDFKVARDGIIPAIDDKSARFVKLEAGGDKTALAGPCWFRLTFHPKKSILTLSECQFHLLPIPDT